MSEESGIDVSYLLEMGFSREKIDKALEVTGNKGPDPAMEWLLAHADELDTAAPASATAPTLSLRSTPDGAASAPATSNETSETSGEGQEAKSLKCEDCGKLFQTQVEVEFHAAKTGHSNFSESTEEKKPLTEEEKAEQIRKVEEVLKQKRKEREEKDKEEALEREKIRIKAGKEMVAAKKRLEEVEMKKILDERKREKEEEKIARQRVKDQIEADKKARKARADAAQGLTVDAPTPTETPKVVPTLVKPVANKNYTETRLQIRLTNGQALTQSFGIKEPLSAVRCYVELNRTDGAEPFGFMTSFPKKIFTADDFNSPLDSLGLVPSAVLMVTKSAPV